MGKAHFNALTVGRELILEKNVGKAAKWVLLGEHKSKTKRKKDSIVLK